MASFFISHSSADNEAVRRVVEQMRAAGFESLFLDFDPDDGIPAGRNWEQELYSQLKRAAGVVFLGSPESTESRWCFTELAFARSSEKPVFPLLVRGEERHPLLDDIQWIDVRGDGEAAYTRLSRALRERFDPRDTFAWDSRRAPYPGLAPFEDDDAAVFYGRDEKIEELLNQLDPLLGTGRLVAVIGPSGSGKSSLVRAGLLPRLQRPPLRDRWVVVPPFTPGERPVSAVARALALALEERGVRRDRLDLEREIERDPKALVETARDLLRPGQSAVLLVLDQAEELTTLAAEPDRAAFERVLTAARGASSPIWIIATYRSEYLSSSLENATIAGRIDAPVLLGALERSRIPQVIEGPADRAGIRFEPGLVGRMVEDTHGGDALPLLAYTLQQLYERASDGGSPGASTITADDYAAIGGVEGALRSRADAVASRFEVDVVLATLVTLSTLDAADQPARRRVRRAALDESENEVAQAFVEARLLKSEGSGDDATVEVVHEALFRVWPPLAEAIESSRDRLRHRADLERRAGEWDEEGRHDSYLLRGRQLESIRRALEAHVDELDEVERTYLAASIALEESARRASRRRVRIAVGGLSTALLLISIGALLAAWQWRAAQEQRDTSRAGELAALATGELATDPAAAVRLAAQAARVKATPEAVDALRTALATSQVLAVLRPHTESVDWAAFSPDGTKVVTASGGDDGTAQVFRAGGGEPIAVLRGHTKALTTAAFSPDGTKIVTGSYDGTARVFRAGGGAALAVLHGDPDTVWSAAFSPDGTKVVTAGDGGTVRVFPAGGGPALAEIRPHGGVVHTAAFSPDGTKIVVALDDHTARVFPAGGGAALAVLRGHVEAVNTAAFSSDGTKIVTSSNDETARVFPAGGGKALTVLETPGDLVNTAAFSPDGKMVVTAGYDGDARVFRARGGPAVTVLRGHTDPVNSAVFSPDGTKVVTASDDGTARVFRSGAFAPVILRGHTELIRSAAFSPDGTKVVTASEDGTARVFPAGGGKALTVLDADTKWVTRAAFSPDGTKIVTAHDDGTARVFPAGGGKAVVVLHGHKDVVTSAAFRPDGGRIVTSGYDGTARVFQASGGPAVTVLRPHADTVWSATFNQDGTRIVNAQGDGTARVFPAGGGKALVVLRGHADVVTRAAFSPDGTKIVTSSVDGTARVFPAGGGRALTVLRGHTQPVQSAAFSPDGTLVVTAASDGTARVFRTAGGPALTVLQGPAGGLWGAAFSPDGRRIVTAGDDGNARVYPCDVCGPLPDLLALADAQA